jgi:hypothetical protein
VDLKAQFPTDDLNDNDRGNQDDKNRCDGSSNPNQKIQLFAQR